MASQAVSDISPQLLLEQVMSEIIDLRQTKRRNIWNLIDETSEYQSNERGVFLPTVENGSASFKSSTSSSADYARAGKAEFGRMTIPYRYCTAGVMVSKDVIDQLNSGKTNPAAWSTFGDFANDAAQSMGEYLDTYLMGDGTGTLGTLLTDPDGSLTTFTLNTAWSVERFMKNQLVQFANPADFSLRDSGNAYTISQSPDPSARTIETSAAVASAVQQNDLVVLKDTINAVPYGLPYHISASTSTWQNVNPATNPKYKGREENFSSTAMTFARLTKMTTSIYAYMNEDYSLETIKSHRWIMHPVQGAIMRQLAIPFAQLFTNNGGTSNLSYGFGQNGFSFDGIPVLMTIKARRDQLYLADMKQFFRVSIGGKYMPRLAGFNGGTTNIISLPKLESTITDSVMTRQDYAAWECYVNIGCKDRRPHLKGINLVNTGNDVPV